MVSDGEVCQLVPGRTGEKRLRREAAIGIPGVGVQVGKHGREFETVQRDRAGKRKPAFRTSKPSTLLKVD
jgi:hypothetical protein